MILLFEEKERTLTGPNLHNADVYTYYNDSADPDVAGIRNLIISWFAVFPEDEKEDLRSRFKVQFHHAFFELFIFMLFTRMGYELKVHPDVPEGNKHPDYLAKKDGYSIYIEVKCLDMQSQTEQAMERRKNALLDAMNTIDARNFLIMLEEINFKDGSQPSGKRIKAFFNQRLAELDPEIYREKLLSSGFTAMPPIIFEDEQVRITTKLLPKAEHLRGTGSRAIGGEPIIIQVGDDRESIKGALETKATRYGKLLAPYIICLNKQTVSLDLEEIQQALYGSSAEPGFFGTVSHPKFTRVTGVYITNSNTANLVSTAAHAFAPHHSPAFPVDFQLEAAIKEILSVPENYHNRKLG